MLSFFLFPVGHPMSAGCNTTRTVRLWAACLSSFLPTARELPTVKSGKTRPIDLLFVYYPVCRRIHGTSFVVVIAVALEAIRPHLATGGCAPGTDAWFGEASKGPHAIGDDPVSFFDVGKADLQWITLSPILLCKYRVVQKNLFIFQHSRHSAARSIGLAMHSQSRKV